MVLRNVKLVIWDLDETFWEGTISEGTVVLKDENIELVKKLTDKGIINSICSKNDLQQVKNKMEEIHLWEYFVFVSVNWSPKGNRIKEIISKMKLRPENVLYIDDNVSNLNEAKFFCPAIMTIMPDEIGHIFCNLDSIKGAN